MRHPAKSLVLGTTLALCALPTPLASALGVADGGRTVLTLLPWLIAAAQGAIALVQLLLSGALLLLVAVPGIVAAIDLMNDGLAFTQGLLALLQVVVAGADPEQCARLAVLERAAGAGALLHGATPLVHALEVNPLLAPLTAPVGVAARALSPVASNLVQSLLALRLASC